jgi:ribose/xylose/arabinose/galactoside ABC-type transport system permease subunit
MIGSIKKNVRQAVPSYIILLLMIIFAIVVSPLFRRMGNARNIFAQSSILAVVAIAQSLVLLIGGIDMSVGAVVSFSTISMAMFSSLSGAGLFFGIVLALAVGALTGLVNGIGFVKFRIPPMIITLSTDALLKGICLILMPSSGGKVSTAFALFAKHRFGVLNVSFLIAILLYVVVFLGLHYSRFGRQVYAIGNNADYAQYSGIDIRKKTILVYVAAGVIAAIAGILLSARISVGNPLVGENYSMDSIAAGVVGGISMNGGIGSIIGALSGTLILSLISNIMNLMRVSPYFQYIIKGLILVFSLLIFQIKRRPQK